MLTDVGWLDGSQLMAAMGLKAETEPSSIPPLTVRSSVLPVRSPSSGLSIKMATLNPSSQSIEFHPPTAFIVNEGRQKTVKVDSPSTGIHFEVTADHDVYTERVMREDGEILSPPLSSAPSPSSPSSFVKLKASALLSHSHIAQSTSSTDSSSSVHWRFQCGAVNGLLYPQLDLSSVLPSSVVGDLSVNSASRVAFFETFGAWLADGSVRRLPRRIRAGSGGGRVCSAAFFHLREGRGKGDQLTPLHWLQTRFAQLQWQSIRRNATAGGRTERCGRQRRPRRGVADSSHSLLQLTGEGGSRMADWLWAEYHQHIEAEQSRARTPEEGEESDEEGEDSLDLFTSSQPSLSGDSDEEDDEEECEGESLEEDADGDSELDWTTTPSAVSIPESLLRAMSAEDSRALLRGLTWRSAQKWRLHTPHTQLKEQIIRLALLAGYSAQATLLSESRGTGRIKRRSSGWLVDFTSEAAHSEPLVSCASVQPSFTDYSWCVQVPPHHLILVRRRLSSSPALPDSSEDEGGELEDNGRGSSLFNTHSRPVWTGNCFEHERVYTYIQSRFYRSPEVLLGLVYSCAIDMWSLGCILCELYTGYPLFPGENEQEQLLCMMEVLGPPPKRMIHDASRKKHFFDVNLQPILTPNSRGKVRIPSSRTNGKPPSAATSRTVPPPSS